MMGIRLDVYTIIERDDELALYLAILIIRHGK